MGDTEHSVDETVQLAALAPDPRNARRHDERDVGLIEWSLKEVGAARSIVVDEAGTVLAGNASVAAATRAGIEGVRVVEADGTELVAVRRSGLTDEQKRRLALLDNRAAELAEWDTEVLASLADEVDLSGLWERDELAVLLGHRGEGHRVAEGREADGGQAGGVCARPGGNRAG